MTEYNKVESVALALDESLATLDRAANQLRRQIDTLRITQDLDVVSEAVALLARLSADVQLGRVAARLARSRG